MYIIKDNEVLVTNKIGVTSNCRFGWTNNPTTPIVNGNIISLTFTSAQSTGSAYIDLYNYLSKYTSLVITFSATVTNSNDYIGYYMADDISANYTSYNGGYIKENKTDFTISLDIDNHRYFTLPMIITTNGTARIAIKDFYLMK